jgi:transposase
MYKWQQVRVLKGNGLGIKKIARQLGMSKNTVKKYLTTSDPPFFTRTVYDHKLDAYEETINQMRTKGYIGTRIYEELVAQGYEGSLSTIHKHLHMLKQDAEMSSHMTTRVETNPGHQMQYDWKEWQLSVAGRSLKIYIHEVVLSYSRKKYFTYSLTITAADIIRALYEAILFFSGAPKELVIDNAKQMVITHDKDDTVRYTDEFLRFCGLLSMDPRACQNYRARTKGKVERPFYYLQEHLLKGLEVDELPQFDGLLKTFMDGYNARSHSSLKESPDERFERERAWLKPLPKIEPTSFLNREIRKVTNDGYVSYGGGFYPVPMRLVLRTVLIEPVFGKSIHIYEENGTLVGEKNVHFFESGIRPPHPEHELMNREYAEKREATRSSAITRFIDLFGDVGSAYIEGLKNSLGPNLYWHLKEITAYADLYPAIEVKDALSCALAIGAYHKNTIKRLLAMKALPVPRVKEAFIPPSPGTIRDLSCYREVGHE